MAVLQMQKLCICALKKDRKSLMEFLQAAGVLELSAEAEPDEVFKRTDTLEDRQKFERNAATADRALEVLAAVVPEETSMLAGLAGKPLAKAGAYRETEANAEALLGQAERILNLQKQITEEKTAAQPETKKPAAKKTTAAKKPAAAKKTTAAKKPAVKKTTAKKTTKKAEE